MAVYYFRNTGNVNWGTATNWSLTDGGGATGAVPTGADDAIFTANSGNCTTNASNRVCRTLNCTGYTNTLTLTFNLSVGGSITLSNTMTIAGTGTLFINTTGTITSNTCVIPRLTIGTSAAITVTCADDINVGNLGINGTSLTQTINSNSINVTGNLTLGISTQIVTVLGTTTINLVGTGTYSQASGTGNLRNNLTINTTGTITIVGTMNYRTGTLTYISGNVVTTGSLLLIIANTTLNTNSLVFNNVQATNNITITLLSDLNIGSVLTTTGITTINGAGYKVNIGGSLVATNTGGTPQGGTADVVMVGTGTISSSGIPFSFNLEINTSGLIRISGTVRFRDDTFKLTKGTLSATSTGILLLTANCTLLGMNKASLPTISVTAGITVTMNEFFSGTPTKSVNVSSVTAGSTYTIVFQDGFEKIAKFVDITDCTLSRPLQLLMLTNNSLVRCTGIRMNNQSPNGIAKNMPSVNQSMSYSANLLTSDPAIN